MTKPRRPVAHHGAAPAVYLDPFGDPADDNYRNNLVQVLSKDNPNRTRVSAIKSVNTVNHQYSIRDLIGIDQDYVEKQWNLRFEGPYGKVKKKILREEWPLSFEDRVTLANFMTMCYVKDHRRLDIFREISQQGARSITVELGMSPNQASDIISAYKRAINEVGIMYLQERVEHYAKVFSLRHKWILFKSDTPLFTGDTPIAICNRIDSVMTTSLDYGIKRFNFAIFPLSRKLGVIFSSINNEGDFMGNYPLYSTGEFDIFIKGNSNFSNMFRNSIASASSEIYIHPRDLKQLVKMGSFEGFYLPENS